MPTILYTRWCTSEPGASLASGTSRAQVFVELLNVAPLAVEGVVALLPEQPVAAGAALDLTFRTSEDPRDKGSKTRRRPASYKL